MRLAVEALYEYEATDVVVLDLRAISDVADYFVIASGTSLDDCPKMSAA